MSADNGIYIGQFVGEHGPEFRVIHAQAIENCDRSWTESEEMQAAYLAYYYGDAEVIYEETRAFEVAVTLYKRYGWTEYGICTIDYRVPFPKMSKKEALDIIEGKKYSDLY